MAFRNIFEDEEEYDIPDFDTFMPGRLGDQIDYAANRYGIDPELFTSLVGQESGFNPGALSPKGAKGFTQLMPGTAGELGVDPLDEEENLLGGAKYLAQQLDRYDGNTELGLAAYNAGAGNVDKYGGVPPFAETQNYVSKITGKPLPQLPILSRAKSRAGDVTQIAQNRLDMRDDLTSQIEALSDTKQQALEGINTDGNLDTDSAIAIALSAILPTLIGWGVNGRQGAAAGAESGAAGANAGLAMAQNQIKNRNDVNKFVYIDAAQRLAQRQGDLQRVENSIADRKERNEELEWSYGSGGTRRGVTAATQSFEPEVAAIIAKAQRGEIPTQDELALAALTPGASKMINDSLRTNINNDATGQRVKQRQQQLDQSWALGNRRADIQEKQGDSRLAQGDRRLAQADERNAAYREMVKNSNDRAKDRISLTEELARRLPPPLLKEVTGKDLAVQNYQELARMVQGSNVDAERISQVLGGVQDELLDRRDEAFTADGWDGLFNRMAAKFGITPDSYDYQVLERMKQIGRANAIAQPGVATNEDALQEINFVSIKPGQSKDSYLANLGRLADQKMRDLSVILNNAETDGYTAAAKFKQKYGLDKKTITGSSGRLLDTGKRDEQGRRIMRMQ